MHTDRLFLYGTPQPDSGNSNALRASGAAGERRDSSIPGRILLVAFVASLGACGREPPLEPELQAVRCPTNRADFARATFVNARITFLCIPKALADSPHLLHCDLTSRPMVCEDEGSLVFSRSVDGEIFADYQPGRVKHRDGSVKEVEIASRLMVNFRKGPPRTTTFEEVETDWRFLLPEAKRLLPRGFTPVKGALCDREATVLGAGTCNLEARSASLYWHLSVSILADKGVPVYPEEYVAEMKTWFRLLDRLVTDPAK